MTEYVEHSFTRLAEWPNAALEAGWPGHIAANLRALAIESGQGLAGEPELVKSADGLPVDTDEGPKKTRIETWRARTEPSRAIMEATVQAEETASGVWKATIPQGVTILSIRHGLNTRQVEVNLLDSDGFATGYIAPVPIDLGEVEVILSPDSKARRAFVTVAEDKDDAPAALASREA
jgi:hypothetical protein